MRKKIILLAIIVFLILFIFVTIKTHSNSVISDPNIWPEKGDRIAVIDGKEYQYDTKYLYKLADFDFPENYKNTVFYESSDEGYPPEITVRPAGDKTETFQEQAIFYELVFLEALERVEVTEKEVSQEKKFRRMDSLFLPLNLRPVYWHNMRPYMGKYLYIEKYLNILACEYNSNFIPLFEELKKKYSVEMIE